ncbi:hypothetical protein C9374_004051 [Naegleria lovaniensis]|uniref:Guanylate cyclase domain-containing protein n=1 Tax=Naegleria lovaniensis TaxID=51637 RepID=A0AA88H9A7_NAELO|nr:uncharacterized protein C9374_004051 [Naegleria lovaniensis]KAG2394287.1 hypothetical protein C9374_004051 [Naegleria lovaniensis]
MERNGLLVSTSFSAPTVSNGSRLHLAHTNERYKRLATALTERTILHTSSSQLASGASNQRLDKHLSITESVFYHDDRRISVWSIRDNGLDWVLVVSTAENGYIYTIFSGSPALLTISIVLIVLGTVCMIVLTQLVARSIYKVVNNNIKLSKMEIRNVTSSKLLNIIYELSLLQKSTEAIKRGLTTFMHYIPRDLVCDIVRTGQFAHLGMVNIHTSVMFTDIANFTTISETTSISVLIEVLSTYFSIVSQAVENHGGVIDKFIGDGTMSLFSIPHRVLNCHAKCACDAALTALFEIEKFKEKSLMMNWPLIDIRIGINTGEAMIGNIGWVERFNYTAIGDCVNTASRLETLGKHYELPILIGEETFKRVKDSIMCFFVDTVRLKGKVTSIDIYTIETMWECATERKRLIHDQLAMIRDVMHLKDVKQMNQLVGDLLQELLVWNLPKARPIASREKMGLEEGLFSDMKFVSDLLHRSEGLISQQDVGEISLNMTEK